MKEFKGTPGPWTGKDVGIARQDDAGLQLGFIMTFDEKRRDECAANARLIAAAPELLGALTDGTTVSLPELLEWVADRMVHVYGENENIDFVLTLRHRASVCRAAIAKALGETK